MKRTAPNPLLSEIDAFVAQTGISRSRLSKEALHNGDLITRLRRGGRCWPETEQKLRDYMAQQRALMAFAKEKGVDLTADEFIPRHNTSSPGGHPPRPDVA